jgi:hypothetical protein
MSPAIIVVGAAFLSAGAAMVYLTWLLFSPSLPRMSKGGAFYLWLLGLGVTAGFVAFLIVLLRRL